MKIMRPFSSTLLKLITAIVSTEPNHTLNSDNFFVTATFFSRT